MRWLKENKYGNQKTVVDGITFDSRKEASRWQELRLLEKAGEITGLVRQQKIELIPKTKLYRACYYIADFVYFDKRQNKTVYEDVKGYKGGSAYQLFTLKKKMLYWRHGIEIVEV
jgi:poly(A) polymerase Pap1